MHIREEREAQSFTILLTSMDLCWTDGNSEIDIGFQIIHQIQINRPIKSLITDHVRPEETIWCSSTCCRKGGGVTLGGGSECFESIKCQKISRNLYLNFLTHFNCIFVWFSYNLCFFIWKTQQSMKKVQMFILNIDDTHNSHDIYNADNKSKHL